MHELGHAVGLEHTPCGTEIDRDPSYTWDKTFPRTAGAIAGSIGAWGYNAQTKTMFDPFAANDLLGYCGRDVPDWVSDWSYKKMTRASRPSMARSSSRRAIPSRSMSSSG